MHPSVLAKRRAIAVDHIVERATAIADHLELDPALIDALRPTIKDPQTADMLRLEGLAQLMETLADSAGAPARAGATEDQAAEQPTDTEPADVTTVTDDQPVIADLPEPVLENDQAVIPIEEPLQDSAVGGPLPADIMPAEPDQEEIFIEEEQPTAKTSTRSSSRSTSKSRKK